MNPTTGQLVLLALSVMLFAVGAAISLSRLWSAARPLRLSAKICDYLGLSAAVCEATGQRKQRVGFPEHRLQELLAGVVCYAQDLRPPHDHPEDPRTHQDAGHAETIALPRAHFSRWEPPWTGTPRPPVVPAAWDAAPPQ